MEYQKTVGVGVTIRLSSSGYDIVITRSFFGINSQYPVPRNRFFD